MSDRHADVLAIGTRIRALPVIHGSGDCAIRVREELLDRPYDCLAVPLPPSLQDEVEEAVEALPLISAVLQRDAEGHGEGFSYVPIDPCQPVIAALRGAIGERIPRAFIDRETPTFEAHHAVLPDPYALKRVRLESFAAAMLPAIGPPASPASTPTASPPWPPTSASWSGATSPSSSSAPSSTGPGSATPTSARLHRRNPQAPFFQPIQTYPVDPASLVFFLGELPFITALYERGRRELTADDNLSIDGVKELVLVARDRLRVDRPKLADRVTPQLLSLYFQYVRNLTLLDRRLAPDLFNLILAARQTAGDDFALAVAETAREYQIAGAQTQPDETPFGPLRMGIDQAEVPGSGLAPLVSRLPGPALRWRSITLKRRPPEADRCRWKQRWDPFGQCSWPPEDDRVESFHRHVRDQARATLGADLARSEKFTTSVKDGLDIRETLRHWHSREIYVKVIPPDRGSVEAVVFLFDVPADPQLYTHRATWYAEHPQESTLAFFATDPMKDMVGPGIARAQYGGALFLFPPRPVPDIWLDPRLDSLADTLEERLLAAACMHSRERHVALVSPRPPSPSWRRLVKRFNRKLIHLPLSRFGGQTIDRVRTFHVLNGKRVRTYAADFIRDF